MLKEFSLKAVCIDFTSGSAGESKATHFLQAFARIGMVNEAAEAATQAKDGELLNRLRSTFTSNTSAAAIIDTFRDKLSVPG